MSQQINKVLAPLEAKFLSDIPGFELPKGILAKGGTGVGGSTLAIKSPQPYIIAVPTTSLIENKEAQHPNIYGVYYREGKSWDGLELDLYLYNNPVPVFMVTYDSLARLVGKLGELGVNVYQHYRLLVDEYTEALKAYSFRDKAINSMLGEARKFEYTTYMSATPIPEEFTPQEFKDLPYTEVVWQGTTKVKPIRVKTTKPYAAVGNLVRIFKAANYAVSLTGGVSNELFIYINSVRGIERILNRANVLPSEVKIVCADNPRNQDILTDYTIEKPVGPNKPINFFTCKAFSGCDLYSENGLTVVVSNIHQKHTLVDIATDVHQIVGRIRNVNNPFKNQIYHVYNTGAVEMTRVDFDEMVREKVAHTNTQMETYNNLTGEERAAFKKRMSLDLEADYLYFNEETGLLEFNGLKQMSEALDFRITHETYTSGTTVRNAYQDAGFDASDPEHRLKLAKEFREKATTLPFKKVAKEYVSLRHSDPRASRLAELTALEPELKQMYDTLGAGAMRSCKYNKSQLRKALAGEDEGSKAAVRQTILTYFKAGGFFSSNEIVSVFKEANGKYGVTKRVKSADITAYFPAVKQQKRVLGKPVTGYLLEGLRTSQTEAGGPTMG
jgi:hypothetical protein